MDRELSTMMGRLRTKAEEKRKRGREAVEAEYLADLKSIARLESLDHNGEAIAIAAPRPIRGVSVKKSKRKFGPTEASREAISVIPDVFSINDIDAYVSQHHSTRGINRAGIFSAINKLVGMGEIEIAERGKGKSRPTTYRRIQKQEVA